MPSLTLRFLTIKCRNMKPPRLSRYGLPFRPRAVSSILVAVIYHPTNYGATENLALVEHIRLNVYLFSHPDGVIIISGDFNCPSTGLTERQVKHATGLAQVMKVLTRDSSILDWYFTNRPKLFFEPLQLPKIGRSDHFSILLESHSSQIESKTRTKVIYEQDVRDSRLRDFGNWITRQDWSEILSLPSATKKCDKFYSIMSFVVTYFFLLQRVKISGNKPWITSPLKILICKHQKALRLYL